MNKKRKVYKWLGFVVIVGFIYIGFLQLKISQYYQSSPPPKNADYLIVLGARVKGTVPSLALEERIKTAAAYLKENPETIAIASGGKGAGENLSEAEAIKKELVKKGISSNRIILEKQSTDTNENIRFSKRLIPAYSKIGIVVTNDFHLYRGVSLGKDNELNLYGLPAKTPLVAIPKSYIHEYLGITKYYVMKYIINKF